MSDSDEDEFFCVVYSNNYPPSRQNKLDEALLSSGRFSDAIQSLMEWLSKAEAYLSEDQPILGDLDTVNILTEQHKVRATSIHPPPPPPAVDLHTLGNLNWVDQHDLDLR